MSASFFRPVQPGGWWRSFGYGLWTIGSVAGLGSLLLIFSLQAAIEVFGLSEQLLTGTIGIFSIYAGQYGIGLAVLLTLPLIIQRIPWQRVADIMGMTRDITLGDVLMALLMALPYIGATIVAQALVAALVPGFDIDQVQKTGFDTYVYGVELAAVFVALVVLAPLAEELVFRGYLFGNVRRNLLFWPSAILTSVLFGYMHGQWNVAIDTFVLGLFLCYLRERTGAIWASVILHALKNGLAFTLLFVLHVE